MDRQRRADVRTYDAHGRPVTTTDRRRAAGQRDLRGPPRCVRRHERPAGDRDERPASNCSRRSMRAARRCARASPDSTGSGSTRSRPTMRSAGARRVSRPSAGAPAAWTTTRTTARPRGGDDIPGRQQCDATSTACFESEHTDPAGHYSYQLYDVDGRLITSGARTCRRRRVAASALRRTSRRPSVRRDLDRRRCDTALDDQGHATQTQYDRRGRPVQAGRSEHAARRRSTYNGFGETKQTVHVGDRPNRNRDVRRSRPHHSRRRRRTASRPTAGTSPRMASAVSRAR